jgi:hypothetical protein
MSRYYDIVVGEGAMADVGERVAVHYDVKWVLLGHTLLVADVLRS